MDAASARRVGWPSWVRREGVSQTRVSPRACDAVLCAAGCCNLLRARTAGSAHVPPVAWPPILAVSPWSSSRACASVCAACEGGAQTHVQLCKSSCTSML